MSAVQTVEVKPLNIVSAGGKRNGFNAFLASIGGKAALIKNATCLFVCQLVVGWLIRRSHRETKTKESSKAFKEKIKNPKQ